MTKRNVHQRSINEQSLWVSALTNRTTINAMMTDRQLNRHSMFVLIDRIAEMYFGTKKPTSSSFQPIENPQDNSPYRELLGWLITIGEMATFYTATIFDECNSADVCLCREGSTRIEKSIQRVYDAEFNQFKVIGQRLQAR